MRAPTCVGRRAEESWVRNQGASKHVNRAGWYSGMRAPTSVGEGVRKEASKQACQLGRRAQGRRSPARVNTTHKASAPTSLRPTGSQRAEPNAWAGHNTDHPAAPLPHQGVAGLVVRHQPLLLLAHHSTLLLGARNDALQRIGDLVLWGEERCGVGRMGWCPRRWPDSCHSPRQPMPWRPPCGCATCCWQHTELPATDATLTGSHSPAPIQNPKNPTLEISFRLRRAARMAASFIRLARSAPGGSRHIMGGPAQHDARLHIQWRLYGSSTPMQL